MEDLETFLAVIESGSQTAAARRLGRSLQSVNRALLALEKDVGVELVRRTTRKSYATEAGLAFYRRIKPAISEIADARLEAANRRAEPSGLLRIAAPLQFGANYVAPALADFIARYPRIQADLRGSDRPVDLVGNQFDLAIRIRELPDSSLKARRIGQLRTVAYAAPAYLERRGRPRHPGDLARHKCILHGAGEAEAWRFRIAGRIRMVTVSGAFRTDNAAAAHAAARGGLGIGYGPFWQIVELARCRRPRRGCSPIFWRSGSGASGCDAHANLPDSGRVIPARRRLSGAGPGLTLQGRSAVARCRNLH
jgi:DNA-binding transcriptional LysR family regulator